MTCKLDSDLTIIATAAETKRIDREIYGNAFTTCDGYRVDPTRIKIESNGEVFYIVYTRMDGHKIVFG